MELLNESEDELFIYNYLLMKLFTSKRAKYVYIVVNAYESKHS